MEVRISSHYGRLGKPTTDKLFPFRLLINFYGDAISLTTTSGTFLTASPSGVLTANTASRGPLEAFRPLPIFTESIFPSFSIETSSDKYLSAIAGPSLGGKVELRADADEVGDHQRIRLKCQREFVLKAKMAIEGDKGKRKEDGLESGPSGGSREDEMERK